MAKSGGMLGLGQRARGEGGKEGKRRSSGRPKRYLAKCQLCVAHYVQYAPCIFDT
jgi:hypothetical protein